MSGDLQRVVMNSPLLSSYCSDYLYQDTDDLLTFARDMRYQLSEPIKGQKSVGKTAVFSLVN